MLDQIPIEILVYSIIPYLDWKDIYSLRQVNKYLNYYLYKDKEVRGTILKVWQTSHFEKSWKYRYYGGIVYRIMRWMFHHCTAEKIKGQYFSAGRIALFKTISYERLKRGDLVKDNIYYGLSTFSKFKCFYSETQFFGRKEYIFNICKEGDFLLNIVIKGEGFKKYELTTEMFDSPILKKGIVNNSTTVIWLGNFYGIPLFYLFPILRLRVYTDHPGELAIGFTYAITNKGCGMFNYNDKFIDHKNKLSYNNLHVTPLNI